MLYGQFEKMAGANLFFNIISIVSDKVVTGIDCIQIAACQNSLLECNSGIYHEIKTQSIYLHERIKREGEWMEETIYHACHSQDQCH